VRFAQERLKGIRRGRGAGSREVGRWQGRWDLGNKGVGGGGWGVGGGRWEDFGSNDQGFTSGVSWLGGSSGAGFPLRGVEKSTIEGSGG